MSFHIQRGGMMAKGRGQMEKRGFPMADGKGQMEDAERMAF